MNTRCLWMRTLTATLVGPAWADRGLVKFPEPFADGVH